MKRFLAGAKVLFSPHTVYEARIGIADALFEWAEELERASGVIGDWAWTVKPS